MKNFRFFFFRSYFFFNRNSFNSDENKRAIVQLSDFNAETYEWAYSEISFRVYQKKKKKIYKFNLSIGLHKND